MLALPLDDVSRKGLLRGPQFPEPEQLHCGTNGRKGIAQLVCQHRQELVLALVRLLQRRRARLERAEP